ncbi:MAG TPA: HAD family hydrolase [Mycobacteriales bacterium]|nr:HAD family hydrolase [Mycobacteriales bacterium]
MATNAGVLFDIDGTLLDTNYLHVLAWWQAFRDNDREVSMWTLHRAIGIGSEELVQRVLGEPDDDVVQAHSRRYEALRDQATAFPQAAELLSACADRGLTVVLATSGAKDDLDWMLPAIGAPDGVIAGTTTSADVEAAKPHPDLLEVAVRDHGLDPARTVAVGDTVYDVEAARSAGLPCIALRSGGIGPDELDGAVALYDDPAALLDGLDSSPLGRLR